MFVQGYLSKILHIFSQESFKMRFVNVPMFNFMTRFGLLASRVAKFDERPLSHFFPPTSLLLTEEWKVLSLLDQLLSLSICLPGALVLSFI